MAFEDTHEARVSQRLGNIYTAARLVGAVSRGGSSRRDRDIIRDLTLHINREINRGSSPATEGNIEIWLNQKLFLQGEIPPGSFVAITDHTEDACPVSAADAVASIAT